MAILAFSVDEGIFPRFILFHFSNKQTKNIRNETNIFPNPHEMIFSDVCVSSNPNLFDMIPGEQKK